MKRQKQRQRQKQCNLLSTTLHAQTKEKYRGQETKQRQTQKQMLRQMLKLRYLQITTLHARTKEMYAGQETETITTIQLDRTGLQELPATLIRRGRTEVETTEEAEKLYKTLEMCNYINFFCQNDSFLSVFQSHT